MQSHSSMHVTQLKAFLIYVFLCVLICVHAHNILKGDKIPHLDWLVMA